MSRKLYNATTEAEAGRMTRQRFSREARSPHSVDLLWLLGRAETPEGTPYAKRNKGSSGKGYWLAPEVAAFMRISTSEPAGLHQTDQPRAYATVHNMLTGLDSFAWDCGLPAKEMMEAIHEAVAEKRSQTAAPTLELPLSQAAGTLQERRDLAA